MGGSVLQDLECLQLPLALRNRVDQFDLCDRLGRIILAVLLSKRFDQLLLTSLRVLQLLVLVDKSAIAADNRLRRLEFVWVLLDHLGHKVVAHRVLLNPRLY